MHMRCVTKKRVLVFKFMLKPYVGELMQDYLGVPVGQSQQEQLQWQGAAVEVCGTDFAGDYKDDDMKT